MVLTFSRLTFLDCNFLAAILPNCLTTVPTPLPSLTSIPGYFFLTAALTFASFSGEACAAAIASAARACFLSLIGYAPLCFPSGPSPLPGNTKSLLGSALLSAALKSFSTTTSPSG